MWCLTNKSMALGSTPSSRICRSHWVTRLALSYEVDTSVMVPMPIRELGNTALGKMWVVVRGVRKQWRILKDNIHLGMDHPPFPRAGPSIPPPSQPQGAGHGGDGPSGTHHGDTDDDLEDTKDEEAGYESNDEYIENENE
uniref:Uncharacterized protein n=1 Tax=Lactuca sativa TaxID=4236 RepID=A0A9R1WK11_LACSA|nr:hypothetical protein LSAT_V11C100042900 [Lactuca sativa]